VQASKEITVLKGHKDRITAVAISADGERVVTGSLDGTAKIRHIRTGCDLFTFRGHSAAVSAVAISTARKRIVTGSYDGTRKIWNGETGQERLTLKGNTGWVWSVAISSDCKHIVTANNHHRAGSDIIMMQDNTAKIWETRTGKELLTFAGHTGEVTSVAVSND